MFLAVPVIGIVAVTWRSALRLLDPRADDVAPDDVPAEPDDVRVVPAPAAAGGVVPDPGS
jgi:hypothetical protein